MSRPAQARFAVREEAGGGFRIERDGLPVECGVRGEFVVAAVQRAIEYALLGDRAEVTAVHAGVVVHHDGAILLAGPSGSGKTTLVRELLALGAEYSSDEYALLDDAGDVHPWPRALMIRGEGGASCPTPPLELNARVRERVARPALLLFLERWDGASFEARPIAQGDAVLRLLRNTPEILEDRPHALPRLAAAARRARAFAGTRGAADDSAKRILELADAAW
jgi:hypothetical protein